MSIEPEFIEMTGETVEDAISKGLNELGVSPFQVMIEVLEEPGGGLFGSEKRPARVRLQLLGGRPTMPPMPPPAPEVKPGYSEQPAKSTAPTRERTPDREKPRSEAAPRAHESPAQGGRGERERRPSRPDGGTRPERGPRPERGARAERPQRPPQSDRLAKVPPERIVASAEPKPFFDLDVDDKDENLPLLYAPDEVPESEQDEEAQVSKVVLNELLERMEVRAGIAVRRAAPGEQGAKSPWVLDVNAEHSLARLIGRRGETLAALQYITRLIASRELQRRVDIVVDVESYKVKRAATLHSLALRMAEEALSSGRTITLEPMPPHERRIIHLALRGREDVVTKSIGEGVTRKVTIVPQTRPS
ncbi:MAG: RNA-binding cell elongation regulator Jag/EloR [bacterium]|nr:RNA-binding cell elongation regulator Jag/EloR [bacterium]